MYHYLRVFWNAYESWDFSKFFDLLDDNCKLWGNLVDEINWKRIKLDDVIWKHIEWKDIEWKNKIIDYFKQYEKPDFCYCEIVMLEFDLHAKWMEAKTSEWKNVRVKVFHDDKKLCLIIMSLFWESFEVHDDILVEFDINEKWLISRINISLKGLYNFRPFILPWDFSHKELWSDWYPKYEEDNIYSEQELCNIWVWCSCEMLKKKWYKVTYAQPMLSRTPNIMPKRLKKCYCVVRGVHKKILKGENLMKKDIY